MPMTIRWQRLRPGARDYERELLLLAAVLAVAAAAAVLWPERWLPVCLFRRYAGIPCPTCGLVRALRLLSRGHLLDAWRMQPLVVVAAGMLAAAVIHALGAVLLKLPRLRVEGASAGAKRAGLALAVLLVLLNWAYLITCGR
jgi:hypothetical protein